MQIGLLIMQTGSGYLVADFFISIFEYILQFLFSKNMIKKEFMLKNIAQSLRITQVLSFTVLGKLHLVYNKNGVVL
jgi:hypothetical protein